MSTTRLATLWLSVALTLAACASKPSGPPGTSDTVIQAGTSIPTADVKFIRIVVHQLSDGSLVYDSGILPSSDFQDTRQYLEVNAFLAGSTDFLFDATAYDSAKIPLAQGNTVQEATQPPGHSTTVLIVIPLNSGDTNPTSEVDITAITDNIPILGQPTLSGTIGPGQTATLHTTATDLDMNPDGGPIDSIESLTFFTTILEGNITVADPDLFKLGQDYQFTFNDNQPVRLLSGVVDRLDQATWTITEIDPKTGQFQVIDRGEGFGIFTDVDPSKSGTAPDVFGTHPIAVFVAKRTDSMPSEVMAITRDVNGATQVGPDNLAVWVHGVVMSFNVYHLPPGSIPEKVYKLRVEVPVPGSGMKRVASDPGTTIDTMKFTPDGNGHFPYGIEDQEEQHLVDPTVSFDSISPGGPYFAGDTLQFDGSNLTHVGFVYFSHVGTSDYVFAHAFGDDSDGHMHVTIPEQLQNGSYDITIYTYDRLHTMTEIGPIEIHSNDRSAPIVTMITSDGQDQGQGSVNLTIDLSDDSPITEVHCILDNGPDEICGSGSVAMKSYAELAPGVHDFQAYGVDQNGNSGAMATPGPTPTERGEYQFEVVLETGRAIYLGQEDVGAAPPSMTRRLDGALLPAQQVLLNAVQSSDVVASLHYARGVRVVAYHPDSVSSVAVDDALAALNPTLGSGWYREFSDPALLDQAMLGADVLMVYDLEDSAAAANLGMAWRASMERFLDDGGVVIDLNGSSPDGEGGFTNHGNEQLFTYTADDGSQLMGLLIAAGLPSDSVYTFQAHDPVAGNPGTQCTGNPADMGFDCPAALPPVANPDGFTAPDGDVVVWSFGDPYIIPVYVNGAQTQCAVSNVRLAATSRSNCPPFSYIAEKPFPMPVAMHVADADVSDAKAVVAYTHTSLSGVTLLDLVHVDLHGNAVLNMRSGGQVTDIQGQRPFIFTFFLGVEGLDVLANNPLPPNPSPALAEGFEMSFPDSGWPANLDQIFGSYGTDTRNFVAGNSFDQPGDANVSELSYVDPSGNLEGLFVTLDASANPISYLVLPAISPGDNISLDPSQFRAPTATFDAGLNHPPAVPPMAAPAGMTPKTNANQSIQTSLRIGHAGLDYDDGPGQSLTSQYTAGADFPDPLPTWKNFTPTVPSGWAQNALVAMQTRFTLTQSASQVVGTTQTNYAETVSEAEYYRNRTAKVTGHSLTIDADKLIPYIGGFTIDSTNPLQPIFSFETAAAMFGDGGSIQLSLSASGPTQKDQLRATFVFPPAAGSFQIPQLPEALSATLPQSWPDYTNLNVSMSGYIRQASAVGSYTAFKKAYPFVRAPQQIELGTDAPAAGQSVYDKLLFFNYNYSFGVSNTSAQGNN